MTGPYTATRELRGDVQWVHVTGFVFSQRRADVVCAAEARKWAAETGLNPGSPVSSGGEYGPSGFRHSVCFVFKSLDWSGS